MTTSPYERQAAGNVRLGYSPTMGWLERSDSSWGNAGAFAGITPDGQVVAWGDPARGGQLDQAAAALLTRQPGEPWIWTVELAASGGAFAARRANGQVVAWGSDWPGGGKIPTELAAALSSGVIRVFGLANGFAALKADGRLITWGPGPGNSQQATTLELSQDYQVVTSTNSLAILQGDRLVGCWGSSDGAMQWSQNQELQTTLSSGVLEVVSNDFGFAARTADGQVVAWGNPTLIKSNGINKANHPDLVKLGSDADGFHGFDSKGRVMLLTSVGGQFPTGTYLKGQGISDAISFSHLPNSLPTNGAIGWLDDSGVYQIYYPTKQTSYAEGVFDGPFLGAQGLVLNSADDTILSLGYNFDQSGAPQIDSPNATGFFSPNSKPNGADWKRFQITGGGIYQNGRDTGNAFAALASNGQIGLWGDPANGASPANPGRTQRLLTDHPAQRLYSNQGAFVALAADGTAISWGNASTGGDQNGSPQVFTNLDHLVSPGENVRIDDKGSATVYNLIVNGQANPPGQSIPSLVREGERLSVVISGDPNGDRSDTTGNQYLWQRNGKASGAGNQASINLDALSTGSWSVTPTYLDLPGFSRTLTPLNVQVQMVDNGQATVQIRPYSFSGPTDHAFSAGNGKMAELLATFGGDPEGIASIERVQWYRDGVPIASAGSPDRSILAALEPGNYSFEATYTDTQGYQRTIHSGRVQIDPAGSVPTQSQLATGGLQTLWRLAEDGRSVERLNSASLRMRPVDMAGTPGYLAISAASDGRTWALDNDGFPCLYDAPSNRFLRQDGSGSDADRRLNLGGGWRQIVAARGSSSAPALWLLGDAPLDGSSNVAYLPGALTEGQTLADLKPIPVTAGPQLRLLAVGDDQTPWGIDAAGNLWRWDAASSSFGDAPLAAGVGSQIRQLQMSDQGQVWGLDDQGVLQMWDGETKRFKTVPLDSPFFTQRNAQLSAGVTPTWESFSLSPQGSFVGIPRSGVTLPAGGNGLVCFDTREIRMLRDPSENPSQLQLISGETLQDNGVRQVGQNLAFNLNDQVHVAYMLNGSEPGQWEGAATIPKAQSGAKLRLEPGANRDDKGTRLPVLQVSWLSGLGNDGQQAYGSSGYVSPFGGLQFSEAAPLPPAGALRAATNAPMGLPLQSTRSDAATATGINEADQQNTDQGDIGYTSRVKIEWNQELAKVWPDIDGKKIPGSDNWFAKFASYLFGAGEKKEWKAKQIIRGRIGGYSQPNDYSQIQGRIEYRYELTRDIGDAPNDDDKYFLREKPDFKSYNYWGEEIKPREQSRLGRSKDNFPNGGGNTLTDPLSKQIGFYAYVQLDGRWSIGNAVPERASLAVGAEIRIIIPIRSWANGKAQLSATTGVTIDLYGLYQRSLPVSKIAGTSDSTDNNSLTSYIKFVDSRDQTPATNQTPKQYLVAIVDPETLPGSDALASLEQATPAVDFITDVVAPIARTILSVVLPGGDTSASPAMPSTAPGEALLLGLSVDRQSQSQPALAAFSLPSDSTTRIDPPQQASPETSAGKPSLQLGARIRPYIGALLKVQTWVVDASLHIRVIPYITFLYDFLQGGFAPIWEKTIVRSDLEVAILKSWTFRERLNIQIPGRKAGAATTLSASDALPVTAGEPQAWLESVAVPIRNLNVHMTAESAGIIAPAAQLVRPDGSVIGIITRLLAGNTGLVELFWVTGRQRADGLTIDWDATSLQRIDGSAGFTSDIRLVELGDGRLAVSASHLDAADPLLLPITQLAPGTLYRIDATTGALGGTTSLTTNTPQLGLPADRVWAQLGSSLASTATLRRGWSGDSLIAGASGSKDGAGALYILNGNSLAGLSDLSTLESNSHPEQGLVILGSHQSGSLSGLGTLVINGGDTNRDGYSEILASAPNDQGGKGQVYMVYGGRALELLPDVPGVKNRNDGSIDLDSLDALQQSRRKNLYLQTFEGVSGSANYGSILAGGHDLNGDGLADPLIGYTADNRNSGSVELWSSRPQLEFKDYQPGVLDGEQQAIPHFDRSAWVSARSSQAEQSDLHLYSASSVGDLDADGHGDIVLSSDNMAVLVFGQPRMPVYWEASTVLGTLARASNPEEAAPLIQTWTASWRDSNGQRSVLSFAGADRNGDGLISTNGQTDSDAEIDWVALRVDSRDGQTQVALSNAIAARWQGALTLSNAAVSFDLSSGSFTAPVRLEAADQAGSFSWASDAAGLNLDQGAQALRARLLTSNAPGVLNASGIGDFNGDGQLDLALSQAGYRIPNSDGTDLVDQPGQTAVLYGNANLAGSDAPLAVEQFGQVGGAATGLLLQGGGGELSAVGDWNRDGRADLLIREPGAEVGGNEQAGSQVLLMGRATGAGGALNLDQELHAGRAQRLQGSVANSRSGTSAAAGDFAADGGRSLFIGAPNAIREADLRQAAAGARVFTATQNSDGTWRTPQQIPLPQAAGLQQLSSFTAVGESILATWVRTSSDGQGGRKDELWAAFQDKAGQWQPAQLLQANPRQDAQEITLGEVNGLALTDAQGQANGGVLLAWTCLDPVTGRSFLFQSTYAPSTGWSRAQQQDPDSLLLANEDAISGSQLKLQLNPSTPEQRSQVWAEAGVSGEGDANARLNLMRSGDLSQPLTLHYSTRDQSASAGSQYLHSSGTVQFAAGQASLSLDIPLLDNRTLEYRKSSFAVDFRLTDEQLAVASPQLLLGNTPVASGSGQPILSASVGLQDDEPILMRAIDAGISLLAPPTGSTGEAATASTAVNAIPPSQTVPVKIPRDPTDNKKFYDLTPQNDSILTHTIALVADPGAQEGLGQVYALFVAATASSTANPGMDWKQLNEIASMDEPSVIGQGDKKHQLNVLIQPEAALAALDPRAGFGTAIVKLRLNGSKGTASGLIGETAFAISAPGNPLDGSKDSRVYVVAAKQIQQWAVTNPKAPFILTDSNALIIKQDSGGLFGSVLSAADLDGDGNDELLVGAPGDSTVTVISGSQLLINTALLNGQKTPSDLKAKVLQDSSSNAVNGSSGFGSAITALDLDGDKRLDLAVGAPKALPVRASTVFDDAGPIMANGGAVYVVKGTGDLARFQGDVTALVNASNALMFEGQQQTNDRGSEDDPPRPASEGLPPPGSFGFGEELGSALAAVDLNNDGIKDLAIGAPQHTPDNTLRTGRVVTWFGKRSLNWSSKPIDLGSLSAADGVSFVGQQGGGRVGASLAAAGDLQSDRNEDLAIGAPFEDGGAGRVYVAFGSSNRYGDEALKTTGNAFQLDPTSPDSPFQTFEAPPGYQLGQSVVGLGDVNNDSETGIGGADLFLGSPNAIAPRAIENDKGDLEYTAAGQTSIAWGRPWFGPNTSYDVPFTQGVGYLLPFGGVPLALGDMNGDGYGDYALLGSSDDAGGATPAADASKLRIRFGAAVEYEQQQVLLSNFDLTPAKTTAADDSYPLVATGDVDGDSFGDLIALTKAGLRVLLGAPNLSVQGDSQGQWDTAGEPLTVPGTNKPISLLSSGDFDGDGFDDVVVVNQNALITGVGATLTVFWGSAQGLQPGGQQTLTSEIGGTPIVSGLIALDGNGDGTDELAMSGNYIKDGGGAGSGLKLLAIDRQAVNPFGRTLQWLQGDLFSATVPTALSSGDINGDGYSDLLIDQDGKRLALFCGDQKAYLKRSIQSFSRSQAPGPNIQRTQLAKFIDDVNADGRDDLLFSPTSPADTTKGGNPYKRGPYSYIYLGNPSQNNITIPTFWEPLDNDEPKSDRFQGWASHGYVIESLPGEAASYRTGSIGDVNGDGFAETLFSSNRLLVGGTAEPRPHSIAIYGAAKLSTEALRSTTSNDGSSSDDALHQLGSAGKQELLLRGKAGSDLLQVHADPYGATLSIPDSGDNAGRLTVSASSGSTLWSATSPYELVLSDGQLQIIHHLNTGSQHSTEITKAWGRGAAGTPNLDVDRVYLDPTYGALYFISQDASRFTNPTGACAQKILPSGFVLNETWNENRYPPYIDGAPPRFAYGTENAQLLFFPESGRLSVVNRGGPDLRYNYVNTDFFDLYPGDGPLKGKERYTQVLYPGESLLSEAGARKLSSAGQPAAPMLSFNQLQASRSNLSTFLTPFSPSDPNGNTFGVQRIEHDRGYTKDLTRVLGSDYKHLVDGWAWVAPADAAHNNQGPLVAVMDGNGRLTLNAQQVVEKQIKPGSELAVLHPGNPDPFLPATGNVPVLIKPDTPSDQVSQQISRSTNNNFTAVLKGGLDDDRLGIDSLDRFRSRDGQPAGLVDGGPGIDTLFFSSQSSDRQDPVINLVGFGSRIRNIEVIEIPINNTLEIDEAPLLNTSLHRLLIKSRGNAAVTFHVRTAYQYIGDQLDAGIAYSVWSKPNSNLQLWVQQGRVNLTQQLNAPGSAASLASRSSGASESLSAADPIDADSLAQQSAPAYRWYRDGRLIAGATDAVYGAEVLQTLEPGLYVRETDYTDRVGLRQSVTSAPLVVDPARPVTGGTLRLRHTSLDTRQQDRLATPQDGLQPASELLFADFKAKAGARAPGVQRLPLQPSSPSTTGSGLVSLVSGDGQPLWDSAPGSADPYAPGVFDLNGDGRIDTITWQPRPGGDSSLEATLLASTRPASLIGTADGLLGIALDGETLRSSPAALQSVGISLLQLPQTPVALVAIPLAPGETLAGLTPDQRRQRALTLLGSVSGNTPIPMSAAEPNRSLWLPTDQILALLELRGTTPQDWDGASDWQRLELQPTSGAESSLEFRSPSGLAITITSEDAPQDLNGLVARSQTSQPLLDFRSLQGLRLSGTVSVARDSSFNSRLGFYAVDTLQGEIRDPVTNALVAPGEPGYASLAKRMRVKSLDGLKARDLSTRTQAINLRAAGLLAPFAIVKGPQHGKTTYYAYGAANPDRHSHFSSLGTNTIGLEAAPWDSGSDFSDLTFNLQLQPVG